MRMPAGAAPMKRLSGFSKNACAGVKLTWCVRLRPTTPLPGRRIVGLADSGKQQQARVVERPGAEEHQSRRAGNLLAAGVDVVARR